MEGNNDDFGNSFNLTIKEGKNAYIEPYWYNGTFIANNIEKGENEITINYYNENGKNVIIPNVRHDLSYFRHQDEDNLPIITINTKGVVDEIIKDDNTQIETDNISGIKQKDERTKIYGDGTIETHNLICHNGTFQGTINANGIYNGELFENNGRLNNITINNLEVNNFSYNGKARLRIDEKAIIENSINESHIIKNVDIWRQNRGRNGYTWEWNEILFEKDIELASNETICVPSIYVWSRRYTPRKRNNDGAYPNVSIDIHMTDENSVIRSNREEKKGDIYQNGEKSENVYVGYLMNHHGVYYDSHRRVSDLTTMPFQYTNNNDKSQTINLKITVRCFVWLEARQGADYAAISFSSTKQPTFFEIGDEGKEKKNINTPDVVVTSSNPSYPLMRVVSDGIIFITKKGDLIISQDDIKIQKGNVTKSLFDLI